MPSDPPTPCLGAQIFIDLPASAEETPPRLFHLDAREVPIIETDAGSRLRISSATSTAFARPLEPDTDATMLDLTLPPRRSIVIPVAAGRTAFVLAIAGEGATGPGGAEHPLRADHAVGFDDGDAVRFVAGPSGLHALLGGGRPQRQSTHRAGGIAMSSQARVDAAARRFEAGQFGDLEPSA